LQGSS